MACGLHHPWALYVAVPSVSSNTLDDTAFPRDRESPLQDSSTFDRDGEVISDSECLA